MIVLTGQERAARSCPQKQGRALDNPSRVQVQLGEAVRERPGYRRCDPRADKIRLAPFDPVWRTRRGGSRALALWRSLLLYGRLLAGPVSLSFLVPTLQNQLNSQLQGYSFRARDASCGCRAAGASNSGLPMSGSWMKATRRSQKRRLPRSASASGRCSSSRLRLRGSACSGPSCWSSILRGRG